MTPNSNGVGDLMDRMVAMISLIAALCIIQDARASRAIAEKPYVEYEAAYAHGLNLEKLGNLDRALRAYRDAINWNPLSAKVRNRLGLTLARVVPDDSEFLAEVAQAFLQAIELGSRWFITCPEPRQ